MYDVVTSFYKDCSVYESSGLLTFVTLSSGYSRLTYGRGSGNRSEEAFPWSLTRPPCAFVTEESEEGDQEG